MPSSSQSICRRLQIGFPDVGLSMVNDRTREELMYITLNRSKVQWVEMRKSRRKPFPSDVQIRLEEIYQTQSNSRTKRSFPGYRVRLIILLPNTIFFSLSIGSDLSRKHC